jgi:GNAT superfamily N-acetyltransferase
MTGHPLDNVIWSALTTRQAGFALGDGSARRFVPEVGPLSAFDWAQGDGFESLSTIVPSGKTVALFLPKPVRPNGNWEIIRELPLLQMIQSVDSANAESPSQLLKLGNKDNPEMIALAALTKPGPFETRTSELGDFYGIREQGKLVAMTGERMRVPGFTEVSAVCTHPDHLGKGYAAALMTRVIKGIRGRGETPILHALEENHRAIGLYERLGFTRRITLNLMVLRRVG